MKKAVVRCLFLLAVAIVCETYTVNENEVKELQIVKPEGCEVTARFLYGYEHDMTCPDLKMKMERWFIGKAVNDPSLPLRDEFRTTVQCSNNSPPYKYLRLTNSTRNSLILKDCPPPEHGSFGDGWPNLEIFKFQHYGNIEPLTRQHFSGLNNVWTLMLFTNSTNRMADDIFSDLTNLTEVYMSVNKANKNIFKNLTKLEWLQITIDSRESLDNFDTSEMKHLPAFKTLELDSNSFTRLTKRFFEGCPYVETLLFRHNSIDAIDANAFEPMANLKYVSMSFNELASLPEGLFSQNKKLETVQILFSFNLTSLPSGFHSNLPNLREVTINCKLTSISNDFIRGSTNLELLNLQFNELTSIPRDLLENHTKLKKIKLNGNKFENTTSTDLFDNKSPITEIRFDYERED